MRNIKHSLTLATCAAALLSGPCAAWSDSETQGSQGTPWDMSPTAAPYITPDSSVSVGLGLSRGDRQQLGMFDGQEDGRGQLLFDARLIKRDELSGTWNLVEGRDLGISENRDLTLEVERQGAWGMRLGYKETPRVAPYTATSRTLGLGTTRPIVLHNDAAGGTDTYEIETDRDRLTLDAFHFISKKIKFNLSLRDEGKEGTRQWGIRSSNRVPAFRVPEFALEPIDWNMRQLESSLVYLSDTLQWQAGYNGSWFGNGNSSVHATSQADPNDPAASDGATYLSLPLDNEAHEFFLSGGYNFPADLRAAFKVSYTRALQDAIMPNLNMTTPSDLLAPTNLQGRVDSTLVSLDVTSHPIPPLRLTTKLRYVEERDLTPVWLPVVTSRANVHTTPLSRRSVTGKLEGTYRLPSRTALSAGWERKEQSRSVPYGTASDDGSYDKERFVPWRGNLDETTYRLGLRRSMSETLNGSLRYTHSIRKGSQYVTSDNIMSTTDGKIGPFFIADRDRDKVRIATEWRPMERLGIQFNVENAWDRYDSEQVPYGRKKGLAQIYAIDTDYAPTDRWLLTAWYSHDIHTTWHESGLWRSPDQHQADKSIKLDNTGQFVGFGVRNQWDYKVKWGANIEWSRFESSYQDTIELTDPTSTTTYPPLQDSVSTTTGLNAFVEYKGLGPGTLRGDFIHERWRTNDWTWQFRDDSPYVYGTATDGTTIATQDHQSSNFIGLRYTTQFQ